VLLRVGVGAGEQVADVGVLAVGGPDLLPVDDEVVTVAHRSRLQRRQVTAGSRLAEQLAPDVLAGADSGQVARALLLGPEVDERAGRE
jgi:hypothetical protein